MTAHDALGWALLAGDFGMVGLQLWTLAMVDKRIRNEVSAHVARAFVSLRTPELRVFFEGIELEPHTGPPAAEAPPERKH